MMSLVPNNFLAPPGGYVFDDPVTGQTFSGDSWTAVIARVVEVRAANQFAPGNPVREVYDQFCARHPGRCHAAPRVVSSGSARTVEQFTARIAAWVAGMFSAVSSRKTLPLTRRSEVDARVRACKGCPHQRDWRGSCVGCSATLVSVWRKLVKLVGGQEHGLLGCSLLNEDTNVAVYLDLPRRDEPTAPEYCWRVNR